MSSALGQETGSFSMAELETNRAALAERILAGAFTTALDSINRLPYMTGLAAQAEGLTAEEVRLLYVATSYVDARMTISDVAGYDPLVDHLRYEKEAKIMMESAGSRLGVNLVLDVVRELEQRILRGQTLDRVLAAMGYAGTTLNLYQSYAEGASAGNTGRRFTFDELRSLASSNMQRPVGQ